MKQILEQAYKIIGQHSKTFLAEKLGISKPTLDSRIKKGRWTNLEIEIIEELSK